MMAATMFAQDPPPLATLLKYPSRFFLCKNSGCPTVKHGKSGMSLLSKDPRYSTVCLNSDFREEKLILGTLDRSVSTFEIHSCVKVIEKVYFKK